MLCKAYCWLRPEPLRVQQTSIKLQPRDVEARHCMLWHCEAYCWTRPESIEVQVMPWQAGQRAGIKAGGYWNYKIGNCLMPKGWSSQQAVA